ncbi:metal-dependent transcriptional regulator [Chloroflexi bacterium TSY]|nr:metal-dependent transcriptional regulator [Chloroflexi bacterium TSY]
MQTFCGITTDGMLDYLAAIYRLGQSTYSEKPEQQIRVTTSVLAEYMHVSSAAASSMLKRLEESHFVTRSTAGGIMLTKQGRLAALQLIRRHRLLEVFLMKVMGFTWDQVDVESHRLEHAISMAFEDKMDQLCGYPTHCPHGDPIPGKDGTMPDDDLISILELDVGKSAVLVRVGFSDARVLRYLSQLHLIPGCRIQIVDKAPFKGPVSLKLIAQSYNPNFATELENEGLTSSPIIGSELASKLFMSKDTINA